MDSELLSDTSAPSPWPPCECAGALGDTPPGDAHRVHWRKADGAAHVRERVVACTITRGHVEVRDVDTCVQVCNRVYTSGVIRPAQQLPGFARAELAPGETRRGTFELAAAQRGYTNLAREFVVEPGRVDYFLGLDSGDRRLEEPLEVVGKPIVLASAEWSFLSSAAVGHA